MPYITIRVTNPTPVYRLTKELHFNKMQITDLTLVANSFSTNIKEILLCMDRFNTNHYLNDITQSTGIPTNNLNTSVLLAIPMIPSSIYAYSPISSFPFIYNNNDQQRIREIALKFLNNDGSVISTTDWGSTILSITMYFE